MQSEMPITMEVLALRDKCKNYNGQTEQLLNLPEGTQDHRLDCFTFIFNDATLAAELLSYYYSRWSKPHIHLTPMQLKAARLQSGQRVMATLKYLFVFSLSAMEFSAKKWIKAYPNDSKAHNLLETNPRHTSLKTIMTKSNTQELIGEDTYKEWKHIIDIRNLVVHNNAIADKTNTYTIDGLIIETSEDKMMKGKLDFYFTLTDLTVDRYYEWMNALIAKYGG